MATKIAGITVEIGGDTTKLTSALKSVNTNIKATQTQLRSVNKLLKLDPSNTTLLAQKQKALTSAIADTKTKLTTLKTAAEQANEQLQKGEITQEQYDALQLEIVATEQQLKSLCEEAAECNTTLCKIESAGDKFEELGTSIASAGKTLTKYVTTVVAAAATAAVTVTSSFETALSKVEALISSSSSDIESDMEKLEEAAREAGETTKFSATEAAEAMSYMGLAGWDAEQMIEGLGGILNLAAASEMDLATASDIVTDYLSAFGLTASDSADLVDKMAYAMSNSNTSTEQLGEAYKNCAANSTQLGYDLNDTTAALMVMADAGIKGGEAGTALSSIMTRLGNNTKNCRDVLAEYGIEVYDSEGNVQSLSSILGGMQEVWSTLTDEQKANLSYVVAGKTAQSQLMTVLGDTTGSFQEYASGLRNCTGTAETMAEIMQDNLSGQLTILKSQLQELAISFGEEILPTVKKFVSGIQSIVEKLNNMNEHTRKVIIVVAGFAAAIGPVLLVVGTLISKMGTAMKAFAKLGKWFLKLKLFATNGVGVMGRLATAFSGITAPVLAVIAVIAVLVAAVVTLWKKNEKFRNTVISIWERIKTTVTDFVDAIKEKFSVFNKSTEGSTSVVETLKNIWLAFCNLLAPLITGTFSQIANYISYALDIILAIVDIFIGIFTGNWSQVFDGLKGIVTAGWTLIKNIFSTFLDTLKGLFDVILSWFGSSWESCWNGIKSFFEGIWSGIVSFFESIWSIVKTVFLTYWTTIFNIISSIWNAIWGVISPLVYAIKNLISTIFNAIKTIINTALSAIRYKISAIWNAIYTFIKGKLTSIKNTMSTVWSSIKNVVANALTPIKTKVVSVFNSISTFVSSIMSKIKGIFSTMWSSIKTGVSSKVSGIYTVIKSGLDKAKTYILNLKDQAKTWGKDLLQNFIDGIKSKISALTDSVNNVAEKIKSILHFSLPDEGPLADADTYMPDFMDLLALGVKNNTSTVLDKVKDVASGISTLLTTSLDTPTFTTPALATTSTTNSTNYGGISIQINGYNMKSDTDLANTVADRLTRIISSEEAVYR